MKTTTQLPASLSRTLHRSGWLLLFPLLASSLSAQVTGPELTIQHSTSGTCLLTWSDTTNQHVVLSTTNLLANPWIPRLESVAEAVGTHHMTVAAPHPTEYFTLTQGYRFEDDFEDGIADGWILTCPDPSFQPLVNLDVTNGQLRVRGSYSGNRTVYCVNTNVLMADYVASIDILDWADGSGNAPHFGIVARREPNFLSTASTFYLGAATVKATASPPQSSLWTYKWYGTGGAFGSSLRFQPKLDPVIDYRLVYRVLGGEATVELYDLANWGAPIATTVGIDSTPPLAFGWPGFVVNDTGGSGTLDVTVDNFRAVGTAPSQAAAPDFSLTGYATIGSGTTGGEGGPTVTVNDQSNFVFHVGQTTPYVVQVEGTINLGTNYVRVRDNTTIVGLGTDATLIGNPIVQGNTNVIIRNLTLTNPGDAGDGDGLTLDSCLNVWVDHCTFVDCADGSLDIKRAADWVTLSWCKFHYTFDSGHNFVSLVGHSDDNGDQDAGKLHVTFHHNWWSNLCRQRMPRVRFGRVHCYNNYYNAFGNDYCVRVALECEVLMENNYFQNVHAPWAYYTLTGQTPGKVWEQGTNILVNVTGYFPGTDTLSAEPNGLNPPPYPYSPDAVGGLWAGVTSHAGAGRGPFAP